MPKVLITGATGLLGREFLRAFQKARWTTVGTCFSRTGPDLVKLDLTDEDAVKALVEKEKPSIIIHSAAERSPDIVASSPDAARALNVTATSQLVSFASSLGIPVLYISTDYVFAGTPGEAPYSETSGQPRPTNLYGQMKLDGERAVLSSAAAAASYSSSNSSSSNGAAGIALGGVLRVPVLYGPVDAARGNAESAINVLLDKVRQAAAAQQPVVTMDHWQRRYPTLTADVADAVVRVAARWLAVLALAEDDDGSLSDADRKWPQVLHFSGAECLTKYEMCAVMAEILGLDLSKGMKADTQPPAEGVQRPYDTRLATGELERLLGDDQLKTVAFRDWWVKELKGVKGS